MTDVQRGTRPLCTQKITLLPCYHNLFGCKTRFAQDNNQPDLFQKSEEDIGSQLRTVPDVRHFQAVRTSDTEISKKKLPVFLGERPQTVAVYDQGTFDLTGDFPGVTEVQAGSYPFMDAKYRQLGLPFQPALSLLATVISTPEPGLAIIDAGLKAITTDNGLPEVIAPAGVRLLRLNEEHGILALQDAKRRLAIGQQLEIIPNHVCPVVNLADIMYLMRNGVCEGHVDVLARGKNR